MWLLILSLALVGFAYYIVTNYLFYDINFHIFNPAIKLPGKNIKEYLPQTEGVVGPIHVSSDFKLDIFADLGGNLPRAMTIDSGGNLLVTSTKKGKVFVLPDQDMNGMADEKIELVSGLNKPHGIAFNKDMLYVAETDKVVRFSYDSSGFSIGSKKVLFDLPSGGKNFTRTIRIYKNKLYTSVGSSCDACIEEDWRRASILVSNLDGSDLKTFAKGLRNAVFFNFDDRGEMWGVDVGRDGLGNGLPPDELNIIEEGKDYGWPYCYGNRVRDSEFLSSQERTYCTDTQAPVYNLPAHVSPSGIVFINSDEFSGYDQGSILLAEHGRWNEDMGYKIVKLSLFADNITGETNFISGFLKDGDVLGRPVDLIFDSNGRLFISDDYSGLIYILTRS